EVKRGLVAAIVMPGLVRAVGTKKAFELVVTGQAITADEALQMGLINRVVPYSGLMSTVMELAERIAAASSEAVERAKALLYRVADLSFEKALTEGRMANEQMRAQRTT